MATLNYYNTHAQSFFDRTINADMVDAYGKFLPLLPVKASILDAGCGSGRDALYFKKYGHNVTAFDASEGMVKLSSQLLEMQTLHLSFQDMNFSGEFDGIWANASLLHVPYEETHVVFSKINHALKKDGVFYASYKYGEAEMLSEDRDFFNMTEETILPYISGLFSVIEVCQTDDTRSTVKPSPANKWLHFLGRKI